MCHRRRPDYGDNSYLGIHLGVDRLEAVLLNAALELTFSAVIRYDVDLPEYRTTDGVHQGAEPNELRVNPVMYVRALDMLLNSLESQGADLHSVAAIGGAAHHTGAIYWSLAGYRALCGLNPRMRLHDQLTVKAFALPTLFWLNSSLERQCLDMEATVGGSIEMRKITGSKAFVGMSGPEIRKIHEDYPEEYQKTVRISLISSFLASLFIGNIASIEYSDGSLMNLLDITRKAWSPLCLTACAPELESRLMPPIASHRLQGHISNYYVNRWNFRADCMIVAASASSSTILSSLKWDSNFLILSLGNCDEIIVPCKERPILDDGIVLCHPTAPGEYVSLFRFENGSRVRDRVCQEVANGDWSLFNEMLAATPTGNEGHIAIHFDQMEPIPEAQGTLRWDKDIDEQSMEALHGLPRFAQPQFEARAVIEGQLMLHRATAASMDIRFSPATKVIVSGHCASNESILQIVADVFNSPVYRPQIPPYLLGAAYRARYAFYQHREVNCNCRRCKIRYGRQQQLTYAEFIQRTPDTLELVAEPTPGSEAIYLPLIGRCTKMCHLLAASKTFIDTDIS